ncbi:hypothetical protein Slin14017_G037640 [Septoria linicola]|nr:hypothetical protein Slin14017_G037640 [Septoria linicola]
MSASLEALHSRHHDLRMHQQDLKAKLAVHREQAASCEVELTRVKFEIIQVKNEFPPMRNASDRNSANSSTTQQSANTNPSPPASTVEHNLDDASERNRPGLVPNENRPKDGDARISLRKLGKKFPCLVKIKIDNVFRWHETWCSECGKNSTSRNGTHYLAGFDELNRH